MFNETDLLFTQSLMGLILVVMTLSKTTSQMLHYKKQEENSHWTITHISVSISSQDKLWSQNGFCPLQQ